MRHLSRRVSALEVASDPPAFKGWHRIIRDEGQTEAEAVAAYEAENGPLGDDDSLIVRVILPEPSHG